MKFLKKFFRLALLRRLLLYQAPYRLTTPALDCTNIIAHLPPNVNSQIAQILGKFSMKVCAICLLTKLLGCGIMVNSGLHVRFRPAEFTNCLQTKVDLFTITVQKERGALAPLNQNYQVYCGFGHGLLQSLPNNPRIFGFHHTSNDRYNDSGICIQKDVLHRNSQTIQLKHKRQILY